MTIENGVDTSRFAAAPRTEEARSELNLPSGVPLLAFTGKIVPRKNLEDLYTLLRSEPEFHLLLVGAQSEPYYGDHYFRRLCAEYADVLPRVHAVGEVSMGQVPRYSEATDVFVFPSHLEGMPNSVLEAMAAGLPGGRLRLPRSSTARHAGDGFSLPVPRGVAQRRPASRHGCDAAPDDGTARAGARGRAF